MRRASVGIVLLCVAASVVGCARPVGYDPAVSLPRGQSDVVVPIGSAGSYLFARVEVNGRDGGHFMIDTGCPCNAVDRGLAGRLGLPTLRRGYASSAAGRRAATLRQVRSLRLGDVELGRHDVGAFDMRVMTGSFGVQVDGILGSALFRSAPVTIDYRARTMTVHDPQRFKPPAGVWHGRLLVRGSKPYVQVTVNGTVTGWLLLDLAHGPAVSFNRSADVMGGRAEVDSVTGTRQLLGVGGVEQYVVGRVESFDVLGHRFEGIEALFAREKGDRPPAHADMGILGNRLLRHFRLTLDCARGRVWAEWSVPESVEELKARGADLEAPDLGGNTRLHCAIGSRDPERAVALLEAGADVHARNRLAQTPLAIAVEGSADVVAALLDRGADVNARDGTGNTVLMYAARGGIPEVVTRLLDRGANVNARNDAGFTPLLIAVTSGGAGIVALLLDRGADAGATDRKGHTALNLARRHGHSAVVGLLRKHDAK